MKNETNNQSGKDQKSVLLIMPVSQYEDIADAARAHRQSVTREINTAIREYTDRNRTDIEAIRKADAAIRENKKVK